MIRPPQCPSKKKKSVHNLVCNFLRGQGRKKKPDMVDLKKKKKKTVTHGNDGTTGPRIKAIPNVAFVLFHNMGHTQNIWKMIPVLTQYHKVQVIRFRSSRRAHNQNSGRVQKNKTIKLQVFRHCFNLLSLLCCPSD